MRPPARRGAVGVKAAFPGCAKNADATERCPGIMDLAEEAKRRKSPLRILLTRLRYLGDVILTTPVIASLKRRYPQASIHYLVEKYYAPVLLNNPYLDEIIELEKGCGSISAVRLMRRRKFTAALDLFYNPRSSLLLYLAGIPIRIGGSRRWRRRLYTKTYSVPADVKSAVEHHMYPLGFLDAGDGDTMPRIYLTEKERDEGAGHLDRILGDYSENDTVVALHPGGTWPSKRWPVGSFADLARWLAEAMQARVIVITGPGEEGIAGAVADRSDGSARVMDVKPLRTLASVLERCSAVVANDGGVLHMSAALGRPTVGVFGPTETGIWFPYSGKGPFEVVSSGVDCSPCHLHHCDDMRCLDGIKPREVQSRVEKVICRGASE